MSVENFNCIKTHKSSFRGTFLYIFFVCLSLTLIYNLQIIPALMPLTKANITTEITRELQSIVDMYLSSEKDIDFVKLIYDSNKNVSALKTDTQKITLANSKIVQQAVNSLCKNDCITVNIPLGTLSGGAIFSGKGPNIKIKVKISPEVISHIENEFYESGINQTIHRIVAKINVKTYALLPFSAKEFNVSAKFCLAETVIVGKVPDAYTKINRIDDELSESDIDDIYDFGATLN